MAKKLKDVRNSIREYAFHLKNDEEVDLISFVKVLWGGNAVIVFSIFLFVSLAAIKSFTSSDEYISQSVLLTEQTSPLGLGALSSLPNIQGLRSFQGQGGVDLSAIPSDLYGSVLENDELIYTLLGKRFYFEHLGEEMDLVTFFSEHEPLDFFQSLRPSILNRRFFGKKQSQQTSPMTDSIGSIQAVDSSVVQISSVEQATISRLKNRMEVIQQQRLIEINLKMPDRRVAAQLNVEVIEALKNFITLKNTERRKQNLEFVQKQTDEAKNKFEDVQLRLATFRDRNMGIATQMARATEQRLQSEYELNFQVYNNLAQQLEQSKIQYQESKPVLTIFKNPNLPLNPSEPKPVMTMIVFAVLGFFLGLLGVVLLLVYEYAKLL